MSLIDRVKNILLTPKTEWNVIDNETATPQSLLTGYVVPLALIPAIAVFIGMGLMGTSVLGIKVGGNVTFGLAMAVSSFLNSILSFYIASYVIDALAPSFGSEKNINKSAQLVAYASTAIYVAGVFQILPSLAFLGILGLYAVYLFYLGLLILKKTPQDKVIVYMIVGAIVIFVISMVVGFILNKIVYGIVGNPYTVDVSDMLKGIKI